MITYEHYRSGDVFGMRYVFEKGDKLPKHAHERELLHNVIVLSGVVKFTSGDESIFMTSGTIFDFDGTKEHVIEATTPAVTLHLFLHGEPESYKTLSDEDRKGTI